MREPKPAHEPRSKTLTVTVLTPARNAAKFIADAMDSIALQTFPHWQMIIVDDASSDQTFRIATKQAKLINRQLHRRAIIVKQNTYQLNIAATRNLLVSMARTEYIAWLDADDLATPDRLRLQVKFLKEHPQVAIVGGTLAFWDGLQVTSYRTYAGDDRTLRNHVFRYSPVAQPAAMIRLKCLLECGQYGADLSPAEDIDMSFRLGAKFQFGNVPELVLYYRINPKSATFNQLRKMELITLKTRWRFRSHSAYRLKIFDVVYNAIQVLTLFLLPSGLKVQLFNWLRNTSYATTKP